MIENNNLIREIPTSDPNVSALKVVITKEEFIEAYNAWIKPQEIKSKTDEFYDKIMNGNFGGTP
mgnify:CR=1 FL=1